PLFYMQPAPTGIYPLSLHDALPILNRRRDETRGVLRSLRLFTSDRTVPDQWEKGRSGSMESGLRQLRNRLRRRLAFIADVFGTLDRKSTRLNSSHDQISYAVFCLKK